MIQEPLVTPNIEASKFRPLKVIPELSWMLPILRYLHEDKLPQDEGGARNIQK